MHGRVLPEVALQADGANARVDPVQTLDDRPRGVLRPVVDHDHLERPRERLESGGGPPVDLVERPLLVVDGDDDGDLGKPVDGHLGGRSGRELGVRHGSTGLRC